MARVWGAVLAAVLVAGGLIAALVGPLPGSVPPGQPVAGAGSGDVLLSADAAAHPSAFAVLAQLQRYFDAINAGDYAAWQTTVTPDRVQPEQAWKDGYRSTRDGTIRIDRIDDEPGGALLVRVRFTSTQAVADAPPDLRVPRICWRSTLPMQGVPPRIARTSVSSSLSAAC